MKKKDVMFWIVIWLFIGSIICICVSSMIISKSVNINRFYDVGKVCDIFESDYQTPGAGIEYLQNPDRFCIKASDAYKEIDLHMQYEWKYIIIKITNLNAEELHTRIIFYDDDREEVGTQEITLVQGKKCIKVEGDISYSNILMSFWETGTEFYIEDMQFCEEKPMFSWSQFIKNIFCIFFVYSIVSLCILKKWGENIADYLKKEKWYKIVSGLQCFYQDIYEMCGEVFKKLGRARKWCRAGLFFVMLMYMQIIMNLGYYEIDKKYKFQILICAVIVFFIALLCGEGHVKKVNWKNKLVGSWMVLWIFACISDFIVTKRYIFSGYVMLFSVGFFFFMWCNMGKKEVIIQEFMTAIKLTFVANVIFCIFCRPEIKGVRYNGGYYNPVMFAMYLLFVWIVILQNIDTKLQKKSKFISYSTDILMGAVLLTFMWKTQSSSGILPAILTFIIFFLKQVVQHRKKIYLLCTVAIVIGSFTGVATEWTMNHIPYLTHTEIKFENETYAQKIDDKLFTVEVYADDGKQSITQSRVLQKILKRNSLEKFTTGRSVYWMGYLREMNLFGNENKVQLWGKKRWPHNGYIAIAYRYGVFAVIPYTVMIGCCICYSWRYLKGKKEYGLFIFLGNICSFILILMENLELPFLFLCWFFMYLMMGILFVKE